jgi:hypothetical protein
MTHLKGTLRRLLTQQSGQIHLLIMAPVLTLSFLSLVVRTASSAVDPRLERKKVAEQLKQRLDELRHETGANAPLPAAHSPSLVLQTTPQIEPHTPLVTTLRGEGLEGWSAGAGRPNQCTVSGPRGEADASGPVCGDGLGKTQTPPLRLVLRGSGAQPRASSSSRLARSEGRNPAEGKGAVGTTLGLSFHAMIPGSVGDKLARRVVSLTVAFEQGGIPPAEYFGTVTGDFDGQGLSFGVLQWNLGSCSLQPLLRAFRDKDRTRFRAVMEAGAVFIERLIAAPCDEAPLLARRVLLDEKGQVKEPWVTRFRALGRTRVFREVQIKYLLPQVQKAYRLADEFGFHSERAVALFFDILIQNGGIPPGVRAQYEQDLQDVERLLGRALDEVERMTILANRQAEAAHPRWVDTVRARKLTIARGGGSVNGISYDLDAVGIKLRNRRTSKAGARHNGETAGERPAQGDLRG